LFTKQLEHIFTKDNFINAFNEISTKAKGIDEVSYTEFQNNFEKNISNLINDILIGQYIPEPIKAIEIKKPNSNEKRPIGIASIKDKLTQKVLYEDIYEYFDKLFSQS
jgi:RNA-directed DNA polymerase